MVGTRTFGVSTDPQRAYIIPSMYHIYAYVLLIKVGIFRYGDKSYHYHIK